MFDLGANIVKITDGSSIFDRGTESLLMVKLNWRRLISMRLLIIEHLSQHRSPMPSREDTHMKVHDASRSSLILWKF